MLLGGVTVPDQRFCRRRRSAGFSVMEIPVRMRQTRTHQSNSGIPYGIQMSDFIH
jgi:hypothetical protein